MGGLLLALTASNHARAQAPAATPPTTLTITGDVGKPLTLTAADLQAMPRQKFEVKAEDGTPHVYEGVLVGELLKRAGAPLGSDLRGNAIASYVVATATDGYQAVFSLAELDPAFTAERHHGRRHHRRQTNSRQPGSLANCRSERFAGQPFSPAVAASGSCSAAEVTR
jgi:hypothetical protein